MTRRSGCRPAATIAIAADHPGAPHSHVAPAGGGAEASRAASAPALLWEAALDATRALRPGRGGLVVTCRAGTFLVTQEGDPEDHVLEPGGSFRTDRRGLVVAWALRAGVLVMRG